MSAPERVWLQWDGNTMRLWAHEKGSAHDIEYVRADMAAAAPDLYEAAEKALHYMRLHKYADQAWADDLEAALAKARGET